MRGLRLAVRVLCVIPFLTGAVDLVDGVGLLEVGGARLGAAASDPTLNSQVGFWGAIWLGYGIVLWRTSADLRREAGLFRLLCGILVLSGLARLAAALAYGLPAPVLTIAMAVELIGGTGFLIWHASALRHPNLNVAAQPYAP